MLLILGFEFLSRSKLGSLKKLDLVSGWLKIELDERLCVDCMGVVQLNIGDVDF
jgi:hypothetical protein